jgi:hypothetical protein
LVDGWQFALESTGAEDADQQSNRSEYLDAHFSSLVSDALKAHDDDTHKRQHGQDIVVRTSRQAEGRHRKLHSPQ